MEDTIKITEYFSKWRNCWVKFEMPPNKGQILSMLKYKYKLR